MSFKKTYISELAGKFIKTKQDINAYVFDNADMTSGSLVGVEKGSEFVLSGYVYTYNDEYRWFELKSDYNVYFAAEDVEYILAEGKDGSYTALGSFLGFLELPFNLPISNSLADKLNDLLKKLSIAAGVLGAILIIKNITQDDGE